MHLVGLRRTPSFNQQGLGAVDLSLTEIFSGFWYQIAIEPESDSTAGLATDCDVEEHYRTVVHWRSMLLEERIL